MYDTLTFFTRSINRLIFVMETGFVFSEIRFKLHRSFYWTSGLAESMMSITYVEDSDKPSD
jgi:hypothetical protein